MIAKNLGDLLTANEEYEFPPMEAGVRHIVEVSGGWGGGNATLGYKDMSGAFAALKTETGAAISAFTANGYVPALAPCSGVFVVKLAGVTNATLRCHIIECPGRD